MQNKYWLTNKFSTKQQGFSLLEVLVAIIIMAVGLLALAQLHIQSIRHASSATIRSQAVLMASDIFDKLRANPQSWPLVVNYNTDAVIAPPKNCFQSNCTANELASFDLNEWANNIRSYLPEGNASIQVNDDIYTVTINWIEVNDINSDPSAEPTIHTFSVGAKL